MFKERFWRKESLVLEREREREGTAGRMDVTGGLWVTSFVDGGTLSLVISQKSECLY